MSALLVAVTALAGVGLGVVTEAASPDPAGAVGETSSYATITPCRVVDTRQPGAGGAFSGTRSYQIAGTGSGFAAQGGAAGGCAIPTTAVAVEATVTAVGPAGDGFARAYPAGTALPNATFLNFTGGESIGNTGTIPTATGTSTADLTLTVFGAATQVVIDINGYHAPPPPSLDGVIDIAAGGPTPAPSSTTAPSAAGATTPTASSATAPPPAHSPQSPSLA